MSESDHLETIWLASVRGRFPWSSDVDGAHRHALAVLGKRLTNGLMPGCRKQWPTAPLDLMPQLFEEQLCVFKIWRLEAFCELVIARLQQLHSLLTSTSSPPEAGKIAGGAQFP
jgi:hypothetical protein